MNESPLKLLLVDDHEVVRRGMAALIGMRAGWQIVGEAADGRAALQLAAERQPDIIVMDLIMPELNGFEATRLILAKLPRVEILILTMHESQQLVREVIEAGARGYVLKSDAGRQLIAAVESLAAHRPYFTSKVAAKVFAEMRAAPRRGRPRATGLTARERQVLQLLAEGCHNREVATRLGITVKTAETHRARLIRKVGATSLSDLVLYAIREKIIVA